MRSATSYFNGPLYRKTLARFWPLWGLYGVIWLFFIPLNFLSTYFDRYYSSSPQLRLLTNALHLPEYVAPGLYFAAFFAILCAMAVFGYLYNHRAACWTHALPMRREALFTTQYLAGLSFLLLPQLAVAALTAVIEVSFLPMSDWGAALSALLAWLLAMSGICLFFFSFAAFCAMFTGHILALPAFYCILNVLADVIYTLLNALMTEFFYGYAGSPGASQVVKYLTPAYVLQDASRWWMEGGFASPATIAVYAGVGVLLTSVSLYVYRRRHVETAGDVVAVSVVRPLFKYGVSFCSGLSFGMFTAAFFGWGDLPALIPCILIWAVIGCFAAEMLLKKSFRVLHAWKGPVAMAGVLLVVCVVCLLDLFNIVGRVPDPAQVETVLVDIDMGYPYDGGQMLSTDIRDPGQLERMVALHQAIVDNRDNEGRGNDAESDYISVNFTYQMSNGSEIKRQYYSVPVFAEDLNTPGTVAHTMQQILDDRELVAQAYRFDTFLKGGRLTGAWLDRLTNEKGDTEYNIYVDDYAQELWDAVLADFDEGTIGVRYLFDMDAERKKNTYRADLTFSLTLYQRPDGSGSAQVGPGNQDIDRTLTITLTPNARHTLAVLEKTGIWEEGYSLDSPNP